MNQSTLNPTSTSTPARDSAWASATLDAVMSAAETLYWVDDIAGLIRVEEEALKRSGAGR
jgi:hypothetical protein